MKNTRLTGMLLFAFITVWSISGFAAINVDRTRIIMDSKQKSLSVVLTNENHRTPYLAQSWVEDDKGKRTNLLLALPPLQRIDPGKKSQVRILQAPGGGTKLLPQDRESLFWFNVREIPPEVSSDENVLQLAMQSQLKLFYRPASLRKADGDTPETRLVVTRDDGHVVLKNPTPYYITVAWLGPDRKTRLRGFNESSMVAPFSSLPLKAMLPSELTSLFVGYLDDYGGLRINMYRCSAIRCVL
ncbi:fimbria/pilus periplasmic chaperone [Salmonella enterica]|nr:fimbrial chaperone protein StdC [Salmonella enterica subsp. enterica serovar Sandiego]EDV5379229.1 fimbria/pilus periplasmic chaperone [Salmonella enterica subsp. enterica serovar Sandiego]EDW2378861.1 fimbria/pilus periplasmic chaperone [Salmonella enterica subsp. enterica serovar Sandiego]